MLLSSSRVYSIKALAALPLIVRDHAFTLDETTVWPAGASSAGLTEEFSTAGPISLYGATKLASEAIAIEYGDAFELPVAINRCGVLAGGGQFGTVEQGIFSYWVRSWASARPLTLVGFEGSGHQVRDALHPRDLADLVERQIRAGAGAAGVWNVGGGSARAMSLAQLSEWCRQRFGARELAVDRIPRKWDVPWVVMDAARPHDRFGWTPTTSMSALLDEIADHHRLHPDWLDLSQP